MLKKKNIAFFISSLEKSGGAERVVATLANELNHNYNVSIITIYGSKSFYKIQNEIKIHELIYESPNSFSFRKSLINNFKITKRLKKHLKKENTDLLITFMTTANVLGILSAKLLNIPVIISERNNPNSQKLSIFWKYLRNLTYPLANVLVVQNNLIKNYFKNIIVEKNISIINNPISPELNISNKEKIQKENIILSVGSLSEQKAQNILIDAFSLLKHENWKLIIVGEGHLRDDLEMLIKKLELEQRVFLPGTTKNISEYYLKSKIFAFSSLYEGSPNALIEAMHFGLPAVSTDCPTGPSELIHNGMNGFLIPINGIKELTTSLNHIITNPQEYDKMSLEAKKAVSKYNYKEIAKDWIELINKFF